MLSGVNQTHSHISKMIKRGLLLLLATSAFAITGCGGGGGGDNPTYDDTIVIGKVVDTNGNPVPGATVTVSGTGQSSVTMSQGDYRLTGVQSGLHSIDVTQQLNGVTYTGSTQFVAASHFTNSNVTVQISPSNNQGAISGYIVDNNNNPMENVRVYVRVDVSPPDIQNNIYVIQSLVAYTNKDGYYKMYNVPVGPTYTICASALGYQNSTSTITDLTSAGALSHKNFQLFPVSGSTASAPSNPFLQAFTQPSSVLQPSGILKPNTASTGSVYDSIRKSLSPEYAKRLLTLHQATLVKHLKPHAVSSFGAYAIEMDLFYDPSQVANLSGYRIYNSSGNNSVQLYDFLQDPFANVYFDYDPYYVPNQQYNFAVSAYTVNGNESSLSSVVSALPLDLVSVYQPTQGQSLSNPVTITWNSVLGATNYSVYVYNTYPGANTSSYYKHENLSSSTTGLTLGSSLPSGNYWVVVAALDKNNLGSDTAISVSQIVKFRVP